MIAEFGIMCLVCAMLVAALQCASAVVPLLRLHMVHSMSIAALLQSLLLTLALASLMLLRVTSDFSVENVAAHSNISLPMLYKLVGTWGNHEGSMLLWVWVLTLFGAMLALKKTHDGVLTFTAVAVQSGLVFGTLSFLLFTSNPFQRIFPPPFDGKMLNPLLQDIALAIHPPLLYGGYVGFSIVFSLAVAALVCGRAGKDWAAMAHGWILLAWSLLTIGIGLGSWWAYRELGWGGWWFWDPVENASLLPWLAGTALLHSNSVLKKRGLLASWVILLAIITFALSMVGTFLVRSGALTSVHSFANDPARGLYILGFIIISTGGALLLYALRGARIESQTSTLPFSREGVIILNNLFLITACASVLLGTLYPLVAEWLYGSQVSVGPPYFNYTFIPLMILPLLFVGIAPFMAWGNASIASINRQIRPAIMATIAFVVIIFSITHTSAAYATAGLGLAAWVLISSITAFIKRPQFKNLPMCMAHAGVGVFVAGVVGVGLWKSESEQWLSTGESVSAAGYELQYEKRFSLDLHNYATQASVFSVRKNGQTVGRLYPEFRTYNIRGITTSEAATYPYLLGDIYVVAGQYETKGSRTAFKIYDVPMIHLIWLGFMLMALGGTIAILQQRKASIGSSSL